MSTGTIKFYNEAKGFGFIVDDATGKEVFVHKTGLSETVREHDRVSFETAPGRKGVNAVDVRKI